VSTDEELFNRIMDSLGVNPLGKGVHKEPKSDKNEPKETYPNPVQEDQEQSEFLTAMANLKAVPNKDQTPKKRSTGSPKRVKMGKKPHPTLAIHWICTVNG